MLVKKKLIRKAHDDSDDLETLHSRISGYRRCCVYLEDDEAVRDSLKWLLELPATVLNFFESGEMFLAKFDPNAIAVLVLDVRMPGMSGLEVQEHLIARKCDIPIIFISGHGDVSMAVSTLKKGAVDFIEKPFDQAALRSLIERMLQEARQRKAKLNSAP